MSEDIYIFASSKEWHKAEYEKLRSSGGARWEWVSTPEELEKEVELVNPRYIFFLHWNWIVPDHIWSEFECVCFHMTDVPYGRGGSPLQNLIVRGHTATTLTALRMVKEMDAGPVYMKEEFPLNGRAEEIYKRAGLICINFIRTIIELQPEPVEQEGEVVTFKRRSPAQSELPQSGSLDTLFDHIRMLDAPTYPLGFIEHGDYLLEFMNAQLDGDELTAKVIVRVRNKKEEECL